MVGLEIGGNASHILVLNCDSHHNVDTDYGDADGFQVTSGANSTTAADIVFRGCRSWNNADDGYDLFFTTARAVVFENCWSFRNGYSDNGTHLGNGTGFKLGGSTTDSRVTSNGGHKLVRCLAWDNWYCGFDENTDTGAVPDTLYNCTGYGNDGWTDYDFDCGLQHVFRNCVTYKTNGVDLGSSDDQYNEWNLGLQITDAAFISVSDAGMDGARQTDGSLPSTNFLRPGASSILVDKGQNIGLPFSGTKPDLGAFEYVPSTALNQSPVVSARTDNVSIISFCRQAITFNLPLAGEYSLTVYTMSGAIVADLWHGQGKAGLNTVLFSNPSFGKGVYLLRLQYGNTQVSQMLSRTR